MIAHAELTDADTLNLRVLLLNAPIQVGRFGVVRKVEVPNSPYFDYAVVAAPRERLIALLRETDGEVLFPWTFGPFRRLTAAFETAGLETQACEPQGERLYPRFDALARVAIELARLGLSEHALESARLALAMDAAGATSGSSLGTVAEAQALAGDLEGARATLDRARRKSPLASLFDSLGFVRAMALVGWIPDALALAQAQEFPYLRTEALTEVAVIQAAKGDRAAAMQTVRVAGSVSAAIKVAEEFVQKGDEKGARDVLADAAALSRENRAELLSIARRQWEWGQVDALCNTVRMAASANARAHELADRETALQQLELAELQAELNALVGARESLEPMLKLINNSSSQKRQDDRVFPYLPLDRVIALQVRLGDRPGARQTLQQVISYWKPQRPDVSDYSAASAIVRAYTAIGDLPEAMELAKKHGAELLYEIADTQRRDGDTAGERETLKLASRERRAEIARKQGRLAWGWGLESNPEGKALIHARAGDPDAAAYFFALAVDAARYIWPPWAQVDKLLDVAEDQMKTGDVGGARTRRPFSALGDS
jgi:hypothetical protein